MAEPKRAPGASRNSSKLSVQELRDFYDKHERRTENFAKVQKVVQMLDLTKTSLAPSRPIRKRPCENI